MVNSDDTFEAIIAVLTDLQQYQISDYGKRRLNAVLYSHDKEQDIHFIGVQVEFVPYILVYEVFQEKGEGDNNWQVNWVAEYGNNDPDFNLVNDLVLEPLDPVITIEQLSANDRLIKYHTRMLYSNLNE